MLHYKSSNPWCNNQRLHMLLDLCHKLVQLSHARLGAILIISVNVICTPYNFYTI